MVAPGASSRQRRSRGASGGTLFEVSIFKQDRPISVCVCVCKAKSLKLETLTTHGQSLKMQPEDLGKQLSAILTLKISSTLAPKP